MELSGELNDLAALLLGKETPTIHWIEGWVGPRSGVNILQTREISCPYWKWTLIVQPVA